MYLLTITNSNALKFTPHGGKITLSLKTDKGDSGSSSTILHGAVTDNGPGLTTEEKGRLFKRFSQANAQVAQNYGGSGLGLNISKELCLVMGGQMNVDSTKGNGSTFSFTISAGVPTEEELSHFLEQQSSCADSTKTVQRNVADGHATASITGNSSNIPTIQAPSFDVIGVAEDNPINLKYLCKVLISLGYTPIPYTNGADLVAHYKSTSISPFNAIVTDLSMPVMGGLEATKLIREAEVAADSGHSPIPIIALSGNSLTEQVAKAFEVGVSDYLLKPAKKLDLMNTLKYWEGVVHREEEHQPMGETLRKIVSGSRGET